MRSPKLGWMGLIPAVQNCERDFASKRPRVGPHMSDAPPTASSHDVPQQTSMGQPSTGGVIPPVGPTADETQDEDATDRTVVLTFDEIVKTQRPPNADAAGQLYRNIGVPTFEQYREYIRENQDNVEDPKLPIDADQEDIRYINEDIEGRSR